VSCLPTIHLGDFGGLGNVSVRRPSLRRHIRFDPMRMPNATPPCLWLLALVLAAHAGNDLPDGVRSILVDPGNATQRWDQKPCAGSPPSHVLQPRDDEGVALALEWASHLPGNQPVSVRSAGHHSACFVNHGVLLDLSRLTTVSLTSSDAAHVEFGPGALARDVNAATLPRGRATVTPHISHVGMGGFIGGGGWGFLSDRYGFAVDLLVRVRVALPNGKLKWIDMDSGSDVSSVPCGSGEATDACTAWALKASYSNFGVITRFVSRTVELPPSGAFQSAAVELPLAATAQAIRAFDAWKDRFKREHVKAICLAGSFGLSCTFTGLGDTAASEFEATVRGFVKETAHEDVQVELSSRAFSEWLTHFDRAWPDGKQHLWRSLFAPRVDRAGDVIYRHLASASAPSTMAMVSIHPPALSASLLAHKTSGDFYLSTYVIVDEGADMKAHEAWEESFWSDVEALHAPQQLQEMDGFGNEMTSTGTEPLVPRVYPAGLARGPLGRLKRQLDPHNMLRANHNIAPEEGVGSPKEEL